MKFSVLAAASAALGWAFASSAQAQTAPSIYGLLDMSAGRFQAPGADKQFQAVSGNMSTSFIGFQGREDLGGGLKAKFALESFISVDTGTSGRYNGDAFFARDAYVGLEGAFGSTVLGRNTTPLFNSTLLFNAFGDSFGFSPSIRQIFSPSTGLPFFGDTTWNNSISYASPIGDNGWSFNLLGNVAEGSGTGSTGKNLGANVLYSAGPLAATVAFQQVKNGAVGTPPGWKRQETYQFGASYDLAFAQLYGQYSLVKDEAAIDTRTTLYSFGVAVPFGLGRVMAQYGSAEADFGITGVSHVTNKTFSVGYDYFLSKRTDLYAVFMNDRTTALSAGNTVAGGLRLRF